MSVQGKKFQFGGEGVELKVPQTGGKKIGVRKRAMPGASEMPGTPGGFKPGRLVINFELFDEQNPNQFLTVLDEPFEVRIKYTAADLKRAEKAGVSLQLGVWDGNKWVVFTRQKHNFRLKPNAQNPKSGGEGVIEISRWGDPPIAWGP